MFVIFIVAVIMIVVLRVLMLSPKCSLGRRANARNISSVILFDPYQLA